ncbi:nicotinamide/nicotinic acid mononucleotide adenylyltransferase 1-like isoform X2 [Pomacea canaliculata]|uniref:nicotinamide/nicotinic acid mononucleotide adenylyltransferase 1-like isoform X2 n=1 Tax=Pomacea canaliculata TaxID=400727 RepID=UPI000D73B7C0|nr:nicotinamide/nicotinic acid mononucleotide adenylyltransferase 1-like isoform X2 [Pomacea canaliculata]
MFSLHNLKRNMATTPKVVLLACGSFNPVTNMHLRMFELARDALNRTGRFNVIDGIISPVSDAYQKKDLVSAKHRCAMLRLALESSNCKWISLDTWESDQSKWSTTESVMAHFREVLDNKFNANFKPTQKRRRKIENNEADVDNIPKIIIDEQPPLLKLLCGADLLESFGTPGLWADEDIEKIVGKHGLVCITRAGSDPSKFIYESDVLSKYQENIHIVTEWIYNDISSTKIRRALRRGESVKYLLPDSVIEYVREHELYGVPDNKYINHLMPSPNDEAMLSPEPEEDNSSSSGEISMVLRSADSLSSRDTNDTSSLLSIERSPARLEPSPKHVPCMTDLGTLVRRVKNYNLRVFQASKITTTPE